MHIILDVSRGGDKIWYLEGNNGKLYTHREGNHPAQIYRNGDKYWNKHGSCSHMELNNE